MFVIRIINIGNVLAQFVFSYTLNFATKKPKKQSFFVFFYRFLYSSVLVSILLPIRPV